MRGGVPGRVGAGALAVLLVLSGCGAAPPDLVRDSGTDVPFTACTDQCQGELGGAKFRILMPAQWNGTLLLYSHGYRNAVAVPGQGAVTTAAEPAPGYAEGDRTVADALLARGFALAGSGWASNGWAVQDGVTAGDQLYKHFAATVATPNRVLVWGDSLGGLVSEELAEQKGRWVDGAAPLCAPLAGVVPNMDLALDVAEGVRALIDPAFKTHDYTSAKQAITQWQAASAAVVKAAGDRTGKGTAKVLALGALVDAAPQTRTYDAATITSQVKGTVEAIVTALGFGTFGRYDVEQRFGHISDNSLTEYASRFSAADRRLIDAVGGAGTTAKIIDKLDGLERIYADTLAVRDAQDEGGDPSGQIRVPTITLHTAADPLVLAQNETHFHDVVQAETDGGADLVQLVTVPPARYRESTGAPYGAGHCAFTPQSRVGVITLLDDWVRSGIYPTGIRATEKLGAGSGFNQLYTPPAWPDPDALESR